MNNDGVGKVGYLVFSVDGYVVVVEEVFVFV